LFVSKGYFPNRVEVRWNILASESLITRFLVYRKPVSSDGDSVLVASLSPDEFNYTDEFLDQNVLYKYTIFAKGISDDLRLPFVNFIEGSGFAFPVGTVSGRITFEGGTAVEGVAVVAETDGDVIGQQTIRLDGINSQLLVPVEAEDTELDLSGGFTLQLWSRYVQNQGSLFKKSDQYELTYDGNNLALTVSGTTLNLPFVAPVDSFFHVSAVYNDQEDYLALYALVNDERLDSARIAFTTPITENLDNIILGEGYDGYLDEVRLWQRALQFDEISANFSRHIAGTEDELSAYWRLDVGAAMEFFDISKQGSTFNENHGRIVDASWSDDSPLQSQLAFRGLTDANGNYTISGFSYETNGSQYRFIPILGQHTFEPNEQTRFVGDGEFIFNGVDFTDVSSFPVSGTVRYRNTKFPVEGVSILIDGKPAIDLEGNLILTDNNGTFTVDVPIGLHGLRVTQQAHGFEGEGRFPPPNGSGVLQLFDFQEALSGLEFIDTTLVKMAGRVVGGPIEAEKLLGFGQSKNNIGSSRIVLKAEKERDLTDSDADSTAVYDENLIETRAEFLFSQPKRATIYTDDQTGEFTAYLPPEKYVVEGILSDGDPNNANFPFADEFHVTIDLRQTVPKNEVFQDTLQAEFLGVLLPNYPPQDPAKFDSVYTVDVADTLFTVGIDTFYFDYRQSFILRNRPTLQVTNLAGEEIFGEQTINVVDENLGIDTDVAVYNNGTYAYGHPIFLQRKTYGLKMSLFEAYFNPDINETDEVPVVDGTIDVQNELAVNTDKVVLTLDERGTTTYTFQGGLPEVNKNPTFPENDFTLPISVTASSGNEGAIKTVWREANPLRGIVFGALPTGNNFVTTGPNEIVTILRDPPGTNSNASIQQGTTTTNTTTSSFTKGFNETFNETLHIGMSLTTFTGAGIGAFQGVINESSSKVDVGLGLDFTQNFQDGNSTVNVTQFNQTISTSTDPGFVSSIGDVFVGFSTNIVYGKTNDLKLLPLVQCDDDCGDVEVSGFRIGIDEGVRMNPEFETGFAFSQAFIESTLIPNLTNLRDNFLIYSQQPDTISAASRVTYVSLVPPDDPRYGTNNTDQTAWGNLAKEENDGNGPSYQVIIPNGIDFTRDSVEFFNEEVNEWISVLAENEKVKVQAQLVKNLSFDGGASISESQTTSNTQEFTYNKTLVFNESVFGETSTEAKIFGVRVGFTHNLGFNFSQVVESGSAVSTENSTTYDFTLEEELGDSYTVDVKAPSDGFGPVFSVRGGATSCPYQDEELTKYYRPGEVLHEATMQREVPSLSVDRAVVADVPENRSAEFLLSLQNNSETAEDFFMTLSAVDATNPFGALLNVDGLLGNGKTFLVQAGETLTKTLKVSKGLSDVLDYEDIELVLRSVCQSDPTDFSPDIADTVAISVFFQPGCSDIAISAPRDNWVINTNTLPSDTMTVNIGNYDLNLNNFRRIAFQYKAVGSSSWITNMVFYNPQQVSQTEFDLLDEPKAFISGPNITYLWDMSGLPDREYDIRAVTFCDIGPGVTHTTPSDILTGTKDTKRPQLFGSPQPADGILSANDEILIQFDETIAAGLLTPFNFSMRGVLNNTARNHNGSVKFDGVNDYVKINDGFNLDKRSWTVEFWLKRGAESREYVVFSKGRLPATDLNFGFTADNRFFIEFGDQRETSSTVFTGQQETVWHHYAVAYDAVNESVNAYRDGEYIFEDIAITANFSGEGPVALGKSETEDNRFLIGNIHDLRIWTKARSLGQVFQDINTRLNGSEVNLVGLWPMDEVRGTQAFDLARSRHATVFAEWQVETQGYALELDGLDDYVEINTASTVVISEEMNFAVEFWFKAETGQSDVVMFSSGRADGTDVLTPPDLAWNIGFDDQQRLFVLNNGNKVTVTESTSPLQDDNWHHFAMSLDRRANLNVFIDGELKATTSSEDFGGLAGSRMWMGARAFKSGASTTIFDQYFDGHIDEFRIWTLDRSREQLLLDMNHRLLGDERGLVAYYPFEAFEISVGVNVLVPSFDEQLSNPPGGGGEGLLSGGPNLTAVTPNIKLARPVEDVNF
ncbi:MAG: LamG-like jellyroll fold domain-containing protein, partial [Bacteroidota bacterium]